MDQIFIPVQTCTIFRLLYHDSLELENTNQRQELNTGVYSNIYNFFTYLPITQ